MHTEETTILGCGREVSKSKEKDYFPFVRTGNDIYLFDV